MIYVESPGFKAIYYREDKPDLDHIKFIEFIKARNLIYDVVPDGIYVYNPGYLLDFEIGIMAERLLIKGKQLEYGYDRPENNRRGVKEETETDNNKQLGINY